ncbi:MAG TPA: CopG family transcriptional regulator [Jatrophihabitantaceae bacterium]|nr:CopG family transcriptional regulator [Jatrophihabitantaceae bacterium]
MQRTNLYLDERQTAALDQISRAQGISRAEVVRRVIDRSLASEPADLDGDLAAIESSFGVLADLDLPTRGPDARAAHLEEIRRR